MTLANETERGIAARKAIAEVHLEHNINWEMNSSRDKASFLQPILASDTVVASLRGYCDGFTDSPTMLLKTISCKISSKE
jgi:hypothetical protein